MSSISGRFGFLFIFFFLLVTVSAAATFWGLYAQAEDALLINLAGRQRMLVQQMTRLAVETQTAALLETAQEFEAVLHALESGGEVLYPAGNPVMVRPVSDPKAQEQLVRVNQIWSNYLAEIALLQEDGAGETAGSASLSRIKQHSTLLVQESDKMVQLLQENSKARLLRLGAWQVGFFISALLLLGTSVRMVGRNILGPLKGLGAAAERIGKGDLLTPVSVDGPAEMAVLSRAIETMRQDLSVARRALAVWTQTLEEKVSDRTQELEALRTVSQEISARLDRSEVLSSITDKAGELLQAETAFLCLLDGEKNRLVLEAVHGPGETICQHSSSAENPYVQAVLGRRNGQTCRDGDCSGSCEIMAGSYRASHLAAPLIVENQVIGALCVGDRRKGRFTEDAPALLARLSGVAAIAIENARLYAQAERLAALEERQRIAAVMHDGLAQMLYALGMQFDQACEQLDHRLGEEAGQTFEQVRRRLAEVYEEVRRSIAALDEAQYPQSTIQEQLHDLICQQQGEADPSVQWTVDLQGSFFLPADQGCQLLGIAQEALANARRHSGASQICVYLEQDDGHARLKIQDNGCGFTPAAPYSDKRLHFGLKILEARAAQLSGNIDISSSPGSGACITLTWPIKEDPLHAGRDQRKKA